MPVDEETRRKIVELYLIEHKTIRDISKLSKKSSRDIVAVLRNSEHNGKAEENKNIHGNNIPTPTKKEEEPDKDLAPYSKAYKLFSEGKRPIEAALILKLPEGEVTKYDIEYLRMTQLPELPQIFKELGVKGISVFLILTQKALTENLKTDEVLNLLKLTNHTLPKLEERIDKMNIKFDVLKYEIDERMDLLYCYNEKIA